MLLWIIGIAVVAIGVWAFWPHRRGVVDGDVSRRMAKAQGDGAMKAGRPYSGEGPGMGPGGAAF